jgi:hypothetical protein
MKLYGLFDSPSHAPVSQIRKQNASPELSQWLRLATLGAQPTFWHHLPRFSILRWTLM